MADAGGGHFYFIADAAGIRDYVTSEVGETLEVVARDVSLQVDAPGGRPGRVAEPVPDACPSGRPGSGVPGRPRRRAAVQVVLRLNFPYGEIGSQTGALISLSDRDGAFEATSVKLGWEYADNKTNDLQDRDRDVDRAVARIFAARARQEAVGRNRAGDYRGARDALSGVARRIRDYAGRDHELREIVSELERETAVMAAPMPELSRKAAFFASANAARMRSPEGKATKGPQA